jgi:hypothetical protein
MCYLSKNLQNTSHFVTLFSAHGDVVVGFAIFHIAYSEKKKIKKVSWEFGDSSHGEAYRRGSTMVTMGLARDHANRDTSVYPGSGPSRLEVNPYFLPASY